MIDDSQLRSTGYGKRSRKNLILFIGLVAVSSYLGLNWGQAMMPIEREIPMGPSHVEFISQASLPDDVTYLTTGPILREFHMSCGPVGYWDIFGPDYNCIVLPYDGQAGIVQVSLPNVFVREFTEIGEVQGGFYKQLAFQRVSEDDKFTVIRIELLEGQSPVKIIGTQSGRADSWHYAGNLVMASVWVFGGLLTAWFGSIAAAKKIIERITKLRVR